MVLTRFRAFLAMVCLVLMPFISLGQPVNDNFTNRTVLSGTSISFTGSLGGATLEQYDLQWSPGGTGSRTVWWSWVCESNGPVTMSCQGGSFLVGNNNGLIVWHANHEYTD